MSGLFAKRRRVWTRIGVPSSSANCLVGATFRPLPPGVAIRVPSPAAGIITITFIAGEQYIPVQIYPCNRNPGFGNQTTPLSNRAPPITGGIVKPKRSVISLIGFCLLTALGAALAFAVIVAGGSVALAGHQYSEAQENSLLAPNAPPSSPSPHTGTTVTRMITDSHCGARHLLGSPQNPSA